MDFLKGITGKIVTGLIALGVIAGGVSWFQMDASTRQMLLNGTGKILAWFLIVVILPWASFFVIGRVAKLESNLAGAILVGTYTLIELVVLGWLFHWTIPGATAWTFFAVGGLFAAAYNLFACDWIAERLE
jgi:hypothetical protein